MQDDRSLNSDAAAEPDDAQAITPHDAAAYIFQMAGELAAIADEQGFSRVAAALELARSQAAEALAVIATSAQPNAAPDDAA
jgi:hypothetical protein